MPRPIDTTDEQGTEEFYAEVLKLFDSSVWIDDDGQVTETRPLETSATNSKVKQVGHFDRQLEESHAPPRTQTITLPKSVCELFGLPAHFEVLLEEDEIAGHHEPPPSLLNRMPSRLSYNDPFLDNEDDFDRSLVPPPPLRRKESLIHDGDVADYRIDMFQEDEDRIAPPSPTEILRVPNQRQQSQPVSDLTSRLSFLRSFGTIKILRKPDQPSPASNYLKRFSVSWIKKEDLLTDPEEPSLFEQSKDLSRRQSLLSFADLSSRTASFVSLLRTSTSKAFKPPKKPVKPNSLIQHRKICCWTVFWFLFLFLAAFGTVAALIRAGKIDGSKVFPWLSPGAIDPNDPSMQLILTDSNTSKGLNGCSNVPTRAARKSSQLSDRFGSQNSGDTCPDGSFRYTLTECDVQQFMAPQNGNSPPPNYLDNVVRQYLPHLNNAIEYYDLNCARNRLANYLAQVRHETNGLTVMRQVLDGGSATIHLLPAYFSRAISTIPPARKMYEETERSSFSDKYSLTDLQRLGEQYASLNQDQKNFVNSVGDMLSRPEITFLISGWYFFFSIRLNNLKHVLI